MSLRGGMPSRGISRSTRSSQIKVLRVEQIIMLSFGGGSEEREERAARRAAEREMQ